VLAKDRSRNCRSPFTGRFPVLASPLERRARQCILAESSSTLFVYGLVFRFRLLPTPPLDDAVTFSYEQASVPVRKGLSPFCWCVLSGAPFLALRAGTKCLGQRHPNEPSRRVRCDSCRCAARRFDDWSDEISNPKTENITLSVGFAAPDHTVPYGTVLSRDAFPGTSCLATIMLSLRDKIHSTAEALLKSTLGQRGLLLVRRKLRFASVNLGGVYQVPWQHFGPRPEICPWKCPNPRSDTPAKQIRNPGLR
jgi:hypothetical protein